MEDHQNNNRNNNNNGGSGTQQGSSRWSPTKEQVNMLEGLYLQGIRTPSAEQIQQITIRLRAFGHIEGKNVFYWFQNHKARQRQKQKQDTVAAYINLNRFLHDTNINTSSSSHHNVNHPQFPNVVCGQYYVPVQTQIGDQVGTFYAQYQQKNKNIPTNTIRLENHNNTILSSSSDATAGYNRVPQSGFTVDTSNLVNGQCCSNYQETLPLFPLSPTGVLQGKLDHEHDISHDLISEDNNFPISTSGSGDRAFYDFFSR